jgi:acyl-CoA synthetase (AMP-forming)/AMP-acid ligase II
MTPPTLLHELLDQTAATHGPRVAVGHGDAVATYDAVRATSLRVAANLVRLGVRRGDRVVLAVAPDVRLPAVLYGCSRVGAVFCVLGEQAPAAAYEHVLADAEPALVVTDNPDAVRLAGDRCVALTELCAPAAAGEPVPPIPVDPVCLIYTSGSTGTPKAVVSVHAQLVFAVEAIQSQLAYRAEDVVFCPLPLSFDYGLYQIFLATRAGARIQLAGPADAGPRLLAELRRTGATVLPAVPGVAQGLARLLSRPGAEPPELRLLTNTGSVLPDDTLGELRGRIPGLGVRLMFGLTECKRTTIMPLDGDLLRPGSCGRALPGTEVFAIDPDGRRLPAGEVGELVVRGPHVMAGYWRRPEETERKFPRRGGLFPELRTGDYGWLDEEGFLYFVGRRDDLYKERGFRVSATEVAAAATRITGVEAAAVLSPGDGRDGAVLVVVSSLAPHEVLARLRTQLEEFKVPRWCQVVPDLPLTTNGKVDRAALVRLVDGSHV